MRLTRKSNVQRVLDTIEQSLEAVDGMRPALRHLGSVNVGKGAGQRLVKAVSHPLGKKPSLPSLGSSKGRQAGLIAAGSLAGLTAASAGISSLRRRSEGSRDDS